MAALRLPMLTRECGSAAQITDPTRLLSPLHSYLSTLQYSANPFLIAVDENTGLAHGYLWLNSAGMEVVLGADTLTWRAVGGVLDLHVFLGPTPERVLQQMQQVVGAC